MNNRIAYFDQMKGFAIILVVMGHCMLFAFGQQDSSLVKWLDTFQMPLFFYISGFFAYKTYKTTNGFSLAVKSVWSKIRTIAIPYLIWCVLWTVSHTDETLVHMLARGGGKYWFLNTLAVLSIIFIMYGYLLRNVKHWILYVVSWAIPFALMISVKYLAKNLWGGVNTYVSVSCVALYYIYYILGYLCKKYERLNAAVFENQTSYAIAFVVFCICFYCSLKGALSLPLPAACAAIILIQNFFKHVSESKDNQLLHILTYIGERTLPIYLIHYYFIPNLCSISNTIFPLELPFVWCLILSLSLTSVIIAVSLIVEKVISINPYLRWILFGKTKSKDCQVQ